MSPTPAGEAAARPAGPRGAARRRRPHRQGRRARDRGVQQGSGRRGRPPAASARTSSTAWRSSRSSCRRCASGARTSRSSCSTSSTKHNRKRADSPVGITDEAMVHLWEYDWPGNVRELENLLERLVVLSEAGHRRRRPAPGRSARITLREEDPAPALGEHGLDLNTAVEEFENRLIEEALRRTKGNKQAAARLLGLKRTTLVAKLRRRTRAARPTASAMTDSSPDPATRSSSSTTIPTRAPSSRRFLERDGYATRAVHERRRGLAVVAPRARLPGPARRHDAGHGRLRRLPRPCAGARRRAPADHAAHRPRRRRPAASKACAMVSANSSPSPSLAMSCSRASAPAPRGSVEPRLARLERRLDRRRRRRLKISIQCGRPRL